MPRRARPHPADCAGSVAMDAVRPVVPLAPSRAASVRAPVSAIASVAAPATTTPTIRASDAYADCTWSRTNRRWLIGSNSRRNRSTAAVAPPTVPSPDRTRRKPMTRRPAVPRNSARLSRPKNPLRTRCARTAHCTTAHDASATRAALRARSSKACTVSSPSSASRSADARTAYARRSARYTAGEVRAYHRTVITCTGTMTTSTSRYRGSITASPPTETTIANSEPVSAGTTSGIASATRATSSVARDTTSPRPARSTRDCGNEKTAPTMRSRSAASTDSTRRAPSATPSPSAAAPTTTAPAMSAPRTRTPRLSADASAPATTSTIDPSARGTTIPAAAATRSTATSTANAPPRPRAARRDSRHTDRPPAIGSRPSSGSRPPAALSVALTTRPPDRSRRPHRPGRPPRSRAPPHGRRSR